jgi:hypothetical protein
LLDLVQPRPCFLVCAGFRQSGGGVQRSFAWLIDVLRVRCLSGLKAGCVISKLIERGAIKRTADERVNREISVLQLAAELINMGTLGNIGFGNQSFCRAAAVHIPIMLSCRLELLCPVNQA